MNKEERQGQMTNLKDTNDSCAARIENSLKSREEDLSDIYEKIEDEDCDDDAWSRLHEFMLGYDTYQIIKIELSTGGPADWIEIKYSNDGIHSVMYHFSDWFDHAEIKVRRSSPLYRYAEEMLEIITNN